MRWTDTGVAVRRGDLRALPDPRSGNQRAVAGLDDPRGPDGAGGHAPAFRYCYGCRRIGWTRRQQHAHRVERRRYHDADGRLMLGVNDDNLNDNSGAFFVGIDQHRGRRGDKRE